MIPKKEEALEYEFSYNQEMGHIRVPMNLGQAIKFTVDPEVPMWATDILKR